MKEPLHDIELIERYFDNSLSTEEISVLRERLKKDFAFQKLFDQEKLLIHTIRLEAANRDLQYLNDVERSLSESKGWKKEIYYYLAAAACVALLIIALLVPTTQESPQNLYTAYFEPHPNIFEPVLRSESGNSIRKNAFHAYEEKDFERAASLFTEILKEKQEAGVLMLLGNANLATGRTETAIRNFSDLIAAFDDLDTPAKWYLALCYLRLEDIPRASSLLKEVKESRGPYASDARELLEEIE